MLVPSMFAERTGRPDKLVALHFHDVRVTKIVDVMTHPGTSEKAKELGIKIHLQTPVEKLIKKEGRIVGVLPFFITALVLLWLIVFFAALTTCLPNLFYGQVLF
jgi:hypothetical protein